MTIQQLFERFNLSSVKLTLPFLEAEVQTNTNDQDAAWEMYVELLTRIVTQPLSDDTGDEKAALESVYSLFATTRQILKERGRKAQFFSKIAVVVLNQVIRPFTARWHRISLENGFSNKETCEQFRKELAELQVKIRAYAAMLAELANVEDITSINDRRF